MKAHLSSGELLKIVNASIDAVTAANGHRFDIAARLQDDVGLDSLGLVELTVALEKHLGCELPDELFSGRLGYDRLDTVGTVVEMLVAHQGSTRHS